MPEYKKIDTWRARFRKSDMMPRAVMNPTQYDAEFPFVCGQFQEALPPPHAPGYVNVWHRKVTDDVPPYWIDTSGAPPVGYMPLYRGKIEELDVSN
eukprot:2451742-Karenia_brevis.AAC.1